jgi:hypothetical protein
LSNILQSFENFAKVLPSISFAPAVNELKTSYKEPAGCASCTTSYFGLVSFVAGGAFSSSPYAGLVSFPTCVPV